MTFFYDLNKRLAALATKQEQQQIAESKKAEAVAQSPLTQALNESSFATKRNPDGTVKSGAVDQFKKAGGKVEKVYHKIKGSQSTERNPDGSIKKSATAGATRHTEVDEADYSAKKARAGKDIGKPGKNFSKIAKGAAERYGSKAAGERVAGAVLNKLRHPKESVEEAVCNECGMYESHCECPSMEEGNAFTGALAKTPKGGKFKVGNKEFTDTSSIEEADVLGQFEDEMTPKQKAFAKLAPPKDKITFADKIAGAKKEVDEMLGDVAAEAMRKAVVGHAGEQEMDEGYAEMDAWLKSREKEKGTGKFDKRKTSTGTVYTRKPETFAGDDEEETSDKPKVKGRPKGSKRAIGAKVKGTSKLHRQAAIAEGDNAKLQDELRELRRVAQMVQTGKADFPKGFASHLESVLYAAMSALGQHQVDEKAPPGAKAERMVKHIKKGYAKDGKLTDKEKSIAYATAWKAHNKGKVEEESTEQEDEKAEKAGKKVAKDIEHDEGHKAKGDNKAEKAGKKVTKDIEYDDKKDKEEKVDETTTAGSVATAPAAAKSGKGMQFGKGVYESLDKQYKQALTESIQVQETVAECGDVMPGLAPEKGITIQASGEDAIKLMQLLKLAGLAGGDACPSCGHSPCDCDAEMVDENSPDWPTNDETIDADPNLRTYSSGLNGPKSTGQTTTPVIASQLRRQASMEESVKLEKTLSDLYKNYKG